MDGRRNTCVYKYVWRDVKMILRKEDSKLYDKLAVAILTGSGTASVVSTLPHNTHKFILQLIDCKNKSLSLKREDEVKTTG